MDASLCNLMMWQANVALPQKRYTPAHWSSQMAKMVHRQQKRNSTLARLGRSTQARNAGWPGRFNPRVAADHHQLLLKRNPFALFCATWLPKQANPNPAHPNLAKPQPIPNPHSIPNPRQTRTELSVLEASRLLPECDADIFPCW